MVYKAIVWYNIETIVNFKQLIHVFFSFLFRLDFQLKVLMSKLAHVLYCQMMVKSEKCNSGLDSKCLKWNLYFNISTDLEFVVILSLFLCVMMKIDLIWDKKKWIWKIHLIVHKSKSRGRMSSLQKCPPLNFRNKLY
jgi:hypothetical protein